MWSELLGQRSRLFLLAQAQAGEQGDVVHLARRVIAIRDVLTQGVGAVQRGLRAAGSAPGGGRLRRRRLERRTARSTPATGGSSAQGERAAEKFLAAPALRDPRAQLPLPGRRGRPGRAATADGGLRRGEDAARRAVGRPASRRSTPRKQRQVIASPRGTFSPATACTSALARFDVVGVWETRRRLRLRGDRERLRGAAEREPRSGAFRRRWAFVLTARSMLDIRLIRDQSEEVKASWPRSASPPRRSIACSKSTRAGVP